MHSVTVVTSRTADTAYRI